jgi:hypothetical protein
MVLFYKSAVIAVSRAPFQQHLFDFDFDFIPLLEKELVWHLVGVIRECNLVSISGNSRAKHGNDCKLVRICGNSRANPGSEGLSRSNGNIDVRGRPVQQKFGRTGSVRDGNHQRCQSQIILCICIGTFLKEIFNKVEVCHSARVACPVHGRFALWARYSVDVGAVFNKLFCWDELVFVG